MHRIELKIDKLKIQCHGSLINLGTVPRGDSPFLRKVSLPAEVDIAVRGTYRMMIRPLLLVHSAGRTH